MPATLDVYRDWLGITEKARPLNYYQLLRVKQFEDDTGKIRSNYRKMNAHVRTFAAGEFSQQSQDLLNELARAMLCLTDEKRKGEYDASLGRKEAAGGRKRSFEELLIARKVLDTAQLDKARNFASAIGVEVRDAVVQQKLAKPDAVMQVYAESLGLPYIDLEDIPPDPALLPKVPVGLARRNSCVPLMVADGQLLIAGPNPITPEIEEELRLRAGMPVRSVLCTAGAVNQVINQHYTREAAAAEMQTEAAKSTGAKTKPTGEPVDPVALAEARKQARNIALVTFNFTFVAAMLALQMRLLTVKTPSFLMSAVMAGAAGAAIGGLVYVIMARRV
jgi:hypothetical protein